MSIIIGKLFIDALLAAGVVTPDERVRRVVIDAPVQGPVVMYVERYGDDRLLEVVPALTGIEIRRDAADVE